MIRTRVTATTTGALIVLAMAAACGGAPGRPAPAALDLRHDACATCRMAVSNPRFAGQVVVPGEEPAFFDDIGCLARYLREHPSLAAGAAAYVADHRTREWVPAAAALYTRVPALDTPMASHIIAHRSPESRDADPDASGGTPLALTAVFDRPVPDGAS